MFFFYLLPSNINIISADIIWWSHKFCDVVLKEVVIYFYAVMISTGLAVNILAMLST